MARYSVKQIFLDNQTWWGFYKKYGPSLRPAIPITIVKFLSCRHPIRGFITYRCSDIHCQHVKRVFLTCKCKACSSCGKKATELWINKQNTILPRTSWQHITFTMPSELWDFFWSNRQLLQFIGGLAAKCILTLAKNKEITPGVFIAIHTFGRDLKRNVHIHLSTTTGGITEDLTEWKELFFDQATLMRMWRYKIIKLFRQKSSELIIPPNAAKKMTKDNINFKAFLNMLYEKTWIVHCSEPTADHKTNVDYLGRYVKRPAIPDSKLKHYDGHSVTVSYLNHKTKKYERYRISVEEFIKKFIQHIPDIGFRMIRYYGFLAHRVRGKLLPEVYKLLKQEEPQVNPAPTFAELIKQNFGFNPLKCVLCGQQMILASIQFGATKIHQLLAAHQELACFRIPCLKNC